MKLFVFDVSPGWDYCGGALVVIAEEFSHAINLLKDYKDEDGDKSLAEHSFYASVEDVPGLKKHYYAHAPTEFFYQTDRGWGQWVLASSFDVKETVARVVLVSYNYA